MKDLEKANEILTEQHKGVVARCDGLEKLNKELRNNFAVATQEYKSLKVREGQVIKEFLEFVNVADDFRTKVGSWASLSYSANELGELILKAKNKYK